MDSHLWTHCSVRIIQTVCRVSLWVCTLSDGVYTVQLVKDLEQDKAFFLTSYQHRLVWKLESVIIVDQGENCL